RREDAAPIREPFGLVDGVRAAGACALLEAGRERREGPLEISVLRRILPPTAGTRDPPRVLIEVGAVDHSIPIEVVHGEEPGQLVLLELGEHGPLLSRCM